MFPLMMLWRSVYEQYVYTLRERRLRCLGHVKRMEPGRIPKDILYGELTKEELAALSSDTKTPSKETSNCVA